MVLTQVPPLYSLLFLFVWIFLPRLPSLVELKFTYADWNNIFSVLPSNKILMLSYIVLCCVGMLSPLKCLFSNLWKYLFFVHQYASCIFRACVKFQEHNPVHVISSNKHSHGTGKDDHSSGDEKAWRLSWTCKHTQPYLKSILVFVILQYFISFFRQYIVHCDRYEIRCQWWCHSVSLPPHWGLKSSQYYWTKIHRS